MTTTRIIGVVFAALVVTIAISAPASATICIVPDNGSGTATLPPAAPSANCTSGYLSPSDVHMIIDGLPPGSTIKIGAEHSDFICEPINGVCSFPLNPGMRCTEAGGSLGGEKECTNSMLRMAMQGTDMLAGFNRMINLPVSFETHVAPRTPGQPVQSFDTDMFRLFGQINQIGDPDFDLLRIVAGTDFGMPSPGHTTLVRQPGNTWNVDSFFDIEYRIDFIGAPGGSLAGHSGSTTGTIRMQAGQPAVFDHLECFKPKDPLKFQATVDLPALAGGLYSAAGCVVKGKAAKYCTPVAKIVTASDVPVTPMPGPSLTSDYLCYKMKCPKIELTQGIVDQFGPRLLEKLKQKELCVPAQKTP